MILTIHYANFLNITPPFHLVYSHILPLFLLVRDLRPGTHPRISILWSRWKFDSFPSQERMHALLHAASAVPLAQDGYTPLIWAVARGHLRTARVLVQHFADVNAQTRIGWRALHFAAMNSREDILHFLLQQVLCPTRDTHDARCLRAVSLGAECVWVADIKSTSVVVLVAGLCGPTTEA